MKEYRYTLEPYKTPSSRYTCPSCGEKRKFSRYVDNETSQHLADHVGRCDREVNCGYHYTPKMYFQDNPERVTNSCTPIPQKKQLPPKPASLISSDIFRKSLTGFRKNNFVTYLHSLFNDTIVNDLINKYCVGTSKYWPGAVVFWQVDIHGNVRAGKIMQYNSETGHRVKTPFNHISWVHSVLKITEYNLQQCFFGEHLIGLNPDLPIAVVESEKTAIIASVYFPQFIWIATGGKHGCKWTSWDISKVLKGRKVVLWPDINAFQDWENKTAQLKQHGLNIDISNLLESEANSEESKAGLDIADFLIRFPYYQFWKVPNPRAP